MQEVDIKKDVLADNISTLPAERSEARVKIDSFVLLSKTAQCHLEKKTRNGRLDAL